MSTQKWSLTSAFCPGASSIREAAEDTVFVLAGAQSRDGSCFAVALSDDRICLRTGEGKPRYFQGHTNRINDIAFGVGAEAFYSVDDDSVALLWDRRSALRPVQRISVEGAAGLRCVDVGCQGRLLAAGTAAGRDSAVVFWDVRSPGRELGRFEESFHEPLTQLRFATTSGQCGSRLLTGSEDGLVCLFDTEISGEDDALLSVLNAESAVARVGFFGPRSDCAFCITSVETLSLWHLERAETMAHFDDARQRLKDIGQYADYLIDCQYVQCASGKEQQLLLCSGTFAGVAHVSRVSLDGFAPLCSLQGASSDALISTGSATVSRHGEGCIRTVAFHGADSKNGLPHRITTGGEDSLVLCWELAEAEGAKARPPAVPLTWGNEASSPSVRLGTKRQRTELLRTKGDGRKTRRARRTPTTGSNAS